MSKYMVLGTLVDRAISMPFAKPSNLSDGCRILRGGDSVRIAKDVRESARLLQEVLEEAQDFVEKGESTQGTRAQLIIDEAGPAFSKTLDDFFDLDLEGQEYVQRRIVHTARRIGAILEKRARRNGWTWIWSQPPLPVPTDRRPGIVRPDLLVGLKGDSGRCMTIDIKTTGKTKNLDSGLDLDELEKDFREWRKRLQSVGFTPVSSVVLSVRTARFLTRNEGRRLEVNRSHFKWNRLFRRK